MRKKLECSMAKLYLMRDMSNYFHQPLIDYIKTQYLKKHNHFIADSLVSTFLNFVGRYNFRRESKNGFKVRIVKKAVFDEFELNAPRVFMRTNMEELWAVIMHYYSIELDGNYFVNYNPMLLEEAKRVIEEEYKDNMKYKDLSDCSDSISYYKQQIAIIINMGKCDLDKP